MKSTAHPRVIERGILTSAYKQEVRQNVLEMRNESLSRIKRSIQMQHEKFQSKAAAVLQISLFAIVLVFFLL
ncbi:MAG: hypothetical protein JXQ93_07255 [Flavobacteriaceae bacterium]